MKTKCYIFLTLFFLFSKVCHAQDDKIYNTLRKSIKLNEKAFGSDEFYEKGYALSISLGVNNKGKIDTIIISQKDNKELNKLFDFEKIISTVKADKQSFKPYKNEFIILLVILMRGDDFIKLNNGNQLLSQWLAIAATASENEKTNRKQLFLSPIIIHSRGKKLN